MTPFRLTDLPFEWLALALLVPATVVPGLMLTLMVGQARCWWRLYRRWARARRRPAWARLWVLTRPARWAAAVAVLFPAWLVLLCLASSPLAVRYQYALDPAGVVAVEIVVLDKDEVRWKQGGPEYAPAGTVTLVDPDEVREAVRLLGRGEPYPWGRGSSVGRRFEVRFRAADGLLREGVWVQPATKLAGRPYATFYTRRRPGLPPQETQAYTNPALGRWLEAAVAGRLPPEP